jgi:hypothetical protein
LAEDVVRDLAMLEGVMKAEHSLLKVKLDHNTSTTLPCAHPWMLDPGTTAPKMTENGLIRTTLKQTIGIRSE